MNSQSNEKKNKGTTRYRRKFNSAQFNLAKHPVDAGSG